MQFAFGFFTLPPSIMFVFLVPESYILKTLLTTVHWKSDVHVP